MQPVRLPTKTLLGAMLLGAATLGLAKLLDKGNRLRRATAGGAVDDADTDAHAGTGWQPPEPPDDGKDRAPYAEGLTHHATHEDRSIGTPAPVDAAKRGDALGEPFSASFVGEVGEVGPSAANKGGLGGGGR